MWFIGIKNIKNSMDRELNSRLFDFLKKNPKVITDSLNNSLVHYDKKNWKLDSVYIEDDNCFECKVFLDKKMLLPATTILDIPKQFLRKEKLLKLKINEEN